MAGGDLNDQALVAKTFASDVTPSICYAAFQSVMFLNPLGTFCKLPFDLI